MRYYPPRLASASALPGETSYTARTNLFTENSSMMDGIISFSHRLPTEGTSSSNYDSSWCQYKTSSSADAEIAWHASRWMPPKCNAYYDSGQLRHEAIGKTYHVPISTFCCTMWSQSTNATDRQTDGRHARRISATNSTTLHG